MKSSVRKIITLTLCAGLAAGFAGCGSDKYAGDWTGKGSYYWEGTKQIPNGTLYQVHIEKNGNNYLVTDHEYSYEKKRNNTNRASDVVYTFDNFLMSWVGTKKVHAAYRDYKFTLQDNQRLKSANAVVINNGGTLESSRGAGYPPMEFHYIEKDKTLQTEYSGKQITLTRSEKSDLTKFLEDTKEAIKETLEADDKKDRQVLSDPNKRFMDAQFVLGNVEFDDSILDKRAKK